MSVIYNNLNQLIKDMIDGYQNDGGTQVPLSVNDFNGNILKGLESQSPTFWRTLLDYIKNETSFEGHAPLYNSDFPSDFYSVYGYIQNYCDLSGDIIARKLRDEFIEHGIDLSAESGMANNAKDYFWNESVSRALAIYLSYFDEAFNANNVFGHLSANDIKEANAGYSFINAPWVKPNLNVDSESYTDVRGSDKIESVLKNNEELQFTRQETSKWMRLLMPKYMRKVEVEDLNRNFWVISQTLGAVCAYLFDDNAPFEDIFKTILSELTQLWENVLYLWAMLALATQRKTITDIHVEVVPLNNNEWQNYIKFDNFDNVIANFNNKSGLISLYGRLSYIVNQYSESNVCIIPQIRNDNYKHNYYAEEFYPGIIFYDRNKNIISYLPFLPVDNEKQISINAKAGAIGKYKYIAGAIKEGQVNYQYIYPVNICDNYDTEPYYLLLRAIPQISVSYDETEGIVIDNFEIDVYDVSKLIYVSGERPLRIEYFKKELNTESQDYEIWSSKQAEDNMNNDSYSGHVIHWICPDTYPAEQTSEPVEITISQGFYAGEFPSYCYPLLAPTYNINVVPVNLVPFLCDRTAILPIFSEPNQTTRTTIVNNAVDSYMSDPVLYAPIANVSNQIRNLELTDTEYAYNKDFSILSTYATEHDASTNEERNFQLYIGNHYTNLWEYNANYHNSSFDHWIEDPNDPTQNIYLLASNDSSLKRHFEFFGQSLSRAAILYNPITGISSQYNDFVSYGAIPTGWLEPIPVDSSGTREIYRGTNISYAKTYLNDVRKIMTENNWFIEFTQVYLGVNPVPKVSSYNSGQKYSNYNTIVNKVMIHVFGPNGFYGCKYYDRYEDIPQNQDIMTANLINWKVGYINRANYESFANSKNGFIVLKDNLFDFEKYPNTGKQISETVGHNFI